ncbi:MAG TPA: hypothetical protein VEC76_12740 [Streptosporangiaceae bacterium]|nr:hypothetical protein [Streptosporangiaceae bacterium]
MAAPASQASASWLMFPAAKAETVDSGQAHEPHAGQEVGFSGWLGLLRAPYELTAEPGDASHPGP